MGGRTETMEETLQNSLLRYMNPQQASEMELREAFCRDIDAYSFDMDPMDPMAMNQMNPNTVAGPSTLSPHQRVIVRNQPSRPIAPQATGKPSRCEHVPQTACAVAYDSHNCDGGWRLVIPQGEMRFRWFTSTYTYRNDIDVIGVRAGCVFTGYSDSSYNGNRMTLRADMSDRWVVLADSPELSHMDEDIESVQCVCTNRG